MTGSLTKTVGKLSDGAIGKMLEGLGEVLESMEYIWNCCYGRNYRGWEVKVGNGRRREMLNDIGGLLNSVTDDVFCSLDSVTHILSRLADRLTSALKRMANGILGTVHEVSNILFDIMDFLS